MDLIGRRFAKLTVIAFDPETRRWRCECQCGGAALVRTGHLTSGAVSGCGIACGLRGRPEHYQLTPEAARASLALSLSRNSDRRLPVRDAMDLFAFMARAVWDPAKSVDGLDAQ